MSALWMRGRAVLRANPGWLAVAILVGVVAGVLIAAAAGAARTTTVNDRFVEATDGADLFVAARCGADTVQPSGEPTPSSGPECSRPLADLLASLPSVEGVTTFSTHQVPVVSLTGSVLNARDDTCASGSGELLVVVATAPPDPTGINRVKVVEGTLPDPIDPSSVLVSHAFAKRTGLRVGDEFVVHPDAEDCGDEARWGRPLQVRIDGIGVMQGQVVPEFGYYFEGVHLSAAAIDQSVTAPGLLETGIVFVPGASTDRFFREAEDAGLSVEPLFGRAELGDAVQARYRVDVTMLNLVAGLGFVGGVFVLGAALMRQASSMSRDSLVLSQIGWRQHDLLRLGLLVGVAVGITAAGIAVVTSIALSRIAPLGEARVLEPSTGLHVAPIYMLSGAAIVLVLSVVSFALGTWLAIRAQLRRTTEPARLGVLGRSAATLPGLPVTASTGIRMAVQPARSAGDLTLRSGIAGVIVGLVGVVGSLTFASGIDHLLTTPRLVGWNWDVFAFAAGGEADQNELAALAADPDVERLGDVAFLFWQMDVRAPDGDSLLGMSFSVGADRLGPTVIEGRGPESADEVGVGPRALEELGLRIGDQFETTSQSRDDGTSIPVSFEIVGTLVLPLDEGGARFSAGFTHDGAARFLPEGQELERNGLMLNIAPGANPEDITTRTGVDLSETVGQADLSGLIATNAERNRRSPEALVVVLGSMALGVLVHLTLSIISRRRRDFTVLRALGYTGGQVRSTTAWMVTLVAGFGLIGAVPIGYIVGRSIWLDYAASLQVFPESSVPWVGIFILVPVVAVVANLAALIPNRRKAHALAGGLHPDE